jgi:hypothetical protein
MNLKRAAGTITIFGSCCPFRLLPDALSTPQTSRSGLMLAAV